MTYPDPDVTAALRDWAFGRVDIADDGDAPRLLAVEAVPTAIALTPDGRILGRNVGFVEPRAFVAWLAGLAPKNAENDE